MHIIFNAFPDFCDESQNTSITSTLNRLRYYEFLRILSECHSTIYFFSPRECYLPEFSRLRAGRVVFDSRRGREYFFFATMTTTDAEPTHCI
jgi:hypothetical protein